MPANTPPKQSELYIWDTSVIRQPDGVVTLRPIAPVRQISVPQAARLLGLGRDRVRELYQAGLITGYKPGAIAVRSDGRASNAALRLDTQSVLDYRARQIEAARSELAD